MAHRADESPIAGAPAARPAKIEVLGEELLEKKVRASNRQGRVYLPLSWLGKRVKIIRVD